MVLRNKDSENVVSYFNQRAQDYDTDSRRWPWRLIRSTESKAMQKMVGDTAGLSMLDLGCGSGYYTKIFAEKFPKRIVAVDISAPMINQINDPRIERFVGDAKSISLKSNFDIIISAGLLEFVPDYLAILKNARKHVKKSGRLILLMPKRNLAGAFYSLFHKLNGNIIQLIELEQFRLAAANCGWSLYKYRFVFPFSIIAALKVASN